MTEETIKLIHDFGWALMPYGLIIWLGVTIYTLKMVKITEDKTVTI